MSFYSSGFSGFKAAPRETPAADKKLVIKLARALRGLHGKVPERDYPAFMAPEERERLIEATKSHLQRDIEWFLHELRSAPTGHRMKVAAAIVQLWPVQDFHGLPTPDTIFTLKELDRFEELDATFPYPCVPMEMRAKVVLGQSPERQSYYVLTKKQAHMWFSCYPDGRWIEEPVQWYLTQVLGVPQTDHDYGPYSHQPIFNERRGLEWFTGVWNDPARKEAMFRERVVIGPDGEIRGTFWTRLDELETVDLVKSIERTFRNAVDRMVAEHAGNFEKDEELIEVPRWWVDTPYAKLLRTPRELSDEGRKMAHCVGLYVHKVASKSSIVVSLRSKECRSTVELNPQTLEVRQHVGEGNRPPHPHCVTILEKLHAMWAEAAGPSATAWPGP
jgi:hypothetical protein